MAIIMSMNYSVNVAELKNHLSEFLEKVEKGDSVIVCKRNEPVAEIHGTSVRKNNTHAGFDPGVKVLGAIEGPAIPAEDWSMLSGGLESES
jgi:prevent-host-death family protein